MTADFWFKAFVFSLFVMAVLAACAGHVLRVASAQIDRLRTIAANAVDALGEVERERDAALNEVPHHCWNCIYHRKDPIEEINDDGITICRYCDADVCYPDEENSSWQWRGPCPENTKEASNEHP